MVCTSKIPGIKQQLISNVIPAAVKSKIPAAGFKAHILHHY
jgi:hypothetical protein